LGKERKGNWAEFHHSNAWLWNDTPRPPFILKKDGYLVAGWAMSGELVGKPPIACKFYRIPYNFLILQLLEVYAGCLVCKKCMYAGCLA
jgi:hypothetical protein